MAVGYTKDFLINAYMHKFRKCDAISEENLLSLERIAERFYDEAGKDKFRVYASLDADAIRHYKNELASRPKVC